MKAPALFLFVVMLGLSACQGIDHAGCPNDPQNISYQVNSPKSVLHTCN
ncbi:hypothetical protein [Swaminathania salitolerans]|uniref:Lipoprotein n=1 Tax=Swaminathania salitolerans TaxID=182838 RepID=A0A511BL76_9PROT|nr:hypothetical protein [Swaminathania salitolerans]GBQ09920.1 hypothetical protein AA21291_0242 [Swaminathania salitolerans LMG 21291]GEL01100.1 hypothetical protein SSA02_02630 [Swaminathania salitolerans]